MIRERTGRCYDCREPIYGNHAEARCRSCYTEWTKREKICYKPPLEGWSYKHAECVSCGHTDSPHKSKGVCERCYARERMQRRKGTFGECCTICEETRAIDLCHIIPQRLGGPHEAWNTLFLCVLHHRCFDHDELYPREWEMIRPKVEEAIQRFGAEISGQWGGHGWPRILERLG